LLTPALLTNGLVLGPLLFAAYLLFSHFCFMSLTWCPATDDTQLCNAVSPSDQRIEVTALQHGSVLTACHSTLVSLVLFC